MKPTTLRYVKSDYHLAKRQTKETMKKLINKLLEKLGYVPKKHNAMIDISRCNCVYETTCTASKYLVFARSGNETMIIKAFPYSILDKDTKAYARLLAEELCEKLNEKY